MLFGKLYFIICVLILTIYFRKCESKFSSENSKNGIKITSVKLVEKKIAQKWS